MPSVSVLPSPPTGGVGSRESSSSVVAHRPFRQPPTPARAATTESRTRTLDEMSIVDIKAEAKERVAKETKGASGPGLLRSAQTIFTKGSQEERDGDLKEALSSYTKVASLVQGAMDSSECKSQPTFHRQVVEFMETSNLSERAWRVQNQLTAFEKLDSRLNGRTEDGDSVNNMGGKSDPSASGRINRNAIAINGTGNSDDSQEGVGTGRSIADRVKSLQENGMTVKTAPKRFSRDNKPPTSPLPPITPLSPTRISPQSSSSQALPSARISPQTTTGLGLVPSTPGPISSASSSHSFVSPSSFGPPSPTSSPSSSPQVDYREFSKAFPTIDELEENQIPKLPPVPLSAASVLSRSAMIPIERPASTPIPPVVNSFASRPASPSKGKSGLAFKAPSDRAPLPNRNSCFPRELQSYIRDYEVLLIDVRSRAEYEREHIRASAIVRIEPSVLLNDRLTTDMLESSISEKEASSVFQNRDKFELVVMYDAGSTEFGPPTSALSTLHRLIYVNAFKKMLKRSPMMLMGGIEAWKRDVEGVPESPPAPASSRSSGVPNGLHPSPNPVSASLVNGQTSSASAAYKSPLLSNGTTAMSGTNGLGLASSSSSVMHGAMMSPDQSWNRQGQATLPDPIPPRQPQHRSSFSMDQPSVHARQPAETLYTGTSDGRLARRPAITRGPTASTSPFSQPIPEHAPSPVSPMFSGAGNMQMPAPITYPTFPPRVTQQMSGSAANTSSRPSSPFVSMNSVDITSPPQASLSPSITRRSSGYLDQSDQLTYPFPSSSVTTTSSSSSYANGSRPIEYPQVIRMPPAVATPQLNNRVVPTRPPSSSVTQPPAPLPPKVPRLSDYPVQYWGDVNIATCGLKNMGNTCYMNAPIQCLSATVPFSAFFREGRWRNAVNYTNPMGSRSKEFVQSFAHLLRDMSTSDVAYLSPTTFRREVVKQNRQYEGTDQHDSQEFLSFLLDGLHEDLNRMLMRSMVTKTPEQEEELERLPQQAASDQEWNAWKMRNDSIIVDYFQGQFRSRLECTVCRKTSTTYNVFSILSLPIPPHARHGKVPLQKCLEALFSTEILEKDDAWDCPRCKTKRRAKKTLSLARLPPVLLIHLKRFESSGRFSDKVDTFVDFPMHSLDLSSFMPPLPVGADPSQVPRATDDPRIQVPPYKYDLYGVTNHVGNLSSGHYTSFIASRGSWLYCDDSSVKEVDPRQVVGQRAYVLFYKRTRS